MTTAALPAFAQTDEDKAAARQLAADGKKAIDEKRWADAIDRFTRAESLVHSPTHVLFLARAHVETGKLVKAREYYLKIKKETLPTTAPKAFHDAKADGEKELLALEPRIPNLKITVSGAEGKTVVVTMDGAVVNAALIDVSRPLDPGEHTVSAKAEGLSTEQKFTLAEGANETLALTLKPDSAAVVAPPPGGGGDKGAEAGAMPITTDTSDAGGGGTNGLRIGSYVALGVGVVGLGLGTIFLLKAGSKKKEADDLCPGGACPESQRATINDLDDQSKSARTVGTIGMVLGVVGIGAGVTLFILSNKKSDSTTASAATPRVQPWIGVGSVGLTGSF
jgi:hypothetical protein